jgi:hypothetical protein
VPVLDLSLVTRSFVALLDFNFQQPSWWDQLLPLDILPLSPDRLTGQNALGFYLYHAGEDPALKNAPPLGNPGAPQQFHPLTLQLSYILTARSEAQGGTAAHNEQRLMGLAMRLLRDVPVIDDATEIGGVPLFSGALAALAGRENRFRVMLQPSGPQESVQYWTAGTQPLRLSAYYQVTGVQIEPPPLTARPSRVSRYGVFLFLRGSPRIDSTSSTIEFTPPGETVPRQVEPRPAEATYGETVTIHGTELADNETDVLVQHPRWDEAEVVDPLLWGVSATSEQVFFTIQTSAGLQPVFPGVYLVQVRVTTFRDMPDGSRRAFPKLSNQSAFAVAPRISAAAEVAGLWTLTGETWDDVQLPDDDIQMFLGPDRLVRTAGAPGAGEFQVTSGTQIQFRQPAALAAGTIVPLRLLIRGAENAPRWVTTV